MCRVDITDKYVVRAGGRLRPQLRRRKDQVCLESDPRNQLRFRHFEPVKSLCDYLSFKSDDGGFLACLARKNASLPVTPRETVTPRYFSCDPHGKWDHSNRFTTVEALASCDVP